MLISFWQVKKRYVNHSVFDLLGDLYILIIALTCTEEKNDLANCIKQTNKQTKTSKTVFLCLHLNLSFFCNAFVIQKCNLLQHSLLLSSGPQNVIGCYPVGRHMGYEKFLKSGINSADSLYSPKWALSHPLIFLFKHHVSYSILSN